MPKLGVFILFFLLVFGCQVNRSSLSSDKNAGNSLNQLQSPDCLSGNSSRFRNFYVSAKGDDASISGDRQAPFASLERARQFIAENRKAIGTETSLNICILGGVYPQSETLRFNENDGGTGEQMVSYRAVPGEKVLLYGGQKISGWQLHQGQIYKAPLKNLKDESWFPELLIENEAVAIKARYPNEGYLKTLSGKGKSSLKVSPDQLPSWSHFKEAQLVIWAGQDWFHNTVPLKSIDAKAGSIELEGETAQGIVAENRYFLQGSLEAIDSPGEFFVDRQEKLVYYWPRALPIENQLIFAPTTQEVIAIRGTSPLTPVQNLRLEGLRILGSNFPRYFREHESTWNQPASRNRLGLITIENAKNIFIEANEISGSGLSCLSLLQHSSELLIKFNHIYNCGYHGVLAIGSDVGLVENGQQVLDNFAHQIVANHIHHVGRLVGHGAGIFLFQSARNSILRNEIHHSPRYAIGIKGSPRWDMMKDLSFGGIKVTWDNHWDFLTGRDNVISQNHIYKVVTDSDDAGAITLWGSGKNNLISNNLIRHLNFQVNHKLGQAIYLDEAADYVTLDGNLIYGLSGDIVQGIFAKGIYTKIYRNMIVLDSAKHTGIRSQEMAGERVDHHIYRKNAIIFRKEAGFLYSFANWSEARVEEANENLFFAADSNFTVRQAGTNYTLKQWQEMAPGHDRLSKILDPKFADINANQFDFGADSPLSAMGIKPLLKADVGLPADFPFSL